MDRWPRVSIEVRDTRDHIHKVLTFDEATYPVKSTKWIRLNLSENEKLTSELTTEHTAQTSFIVSVSDVTLNSNQTSKHVKLDSQQGHVSFTHTFDADTIISGPMKLHLSVSSSNLTDMNLFAFIRKYDANKEEVNFEGAFGYGLDCVTKGWQRVALRKVIEIEGEEVSWCGDDKPFNTIELLEPNKRVHVIVDLMPSSTLFEKGSSMTLFVQGMWMHPTMPLISAANFEPSKQPGQLDIYFDEKSFLVVGVL